MNKEYIERDLVLEIMCDRCCEHSIENPFACQGCEQMAEMSRLPAVDVAPVVRGEWEKEKWTQTDQHICSLCNSTVRVHPQSVQYKYCPYCGAMMRGG